MATYVPPAPPTRVVYQQSTTTVAPASQRRTVPAWAFYTVVAVAIIFGIIAGLLWFFLQSCRSQIGTLANSNCPTVLPTTCSQVNSSGAVLPPCPTSCQGDGDCPSYTPTCSGGTCVKMCLTPADCPSAFPNCSGSGVCTT